jgi:hypothetical protein
MPYNRTPCTRDRKRGKESGKKSNHALYQGKEKEVSQWKWGILKKEARSKLHDSSSNSVWRYYGVIVFYTFKFMEITNKKRFSRPSDYHYPIPPAMQKNTFDDAGLQRVPLGLRASGRA